MILRSNRHWICNHTFEDLTITLVGRFNRGLPTMLRCDLGVGIHRVWLCLNPPRMPDAYSDPTFVQLLRDRFEEMRAAGICAAQHQAGDNPLQVLQHLVSNHDGGHVHYEQSQPNQDAVTAQAVMVPHNVVTILHQSAASRCHT